MANYAEALAEGLKAHRNAARAKAEIDEVLRTFSVQVSQASGGAIRSVQMKTFTRPGRQMQIEELIRMVPERHPFDALVATNHAGAERRLCEIHVADEGYPVGLAFGGEDILCHDRPSLEDALAALLKHPNTGAVLTRLMGESGESGPTESAAEEGG